MEISKHFDERILCSGLSSVTDFSSVYLSLELLPVGCATSKNRRRLRLKCKVCNANSSDCMQASRQPASQPRLICMRRLILISCWNFLYFSISSYRSQTHSPVSGMLLEMPWRAIEMFTTKIRLLAFTNPMTSWNNQCYRRQYNEISAHVNWITGTFHAYIMFCYLMNVQRVGRTSIAIIIMLIKVHKSSQ